MRQFGLTSALTDKLSLTFSVGVRGAVYQVLKNEKLDPIPLDPFYYPTDRQYAKVRLVFEIMSCTDISC